MPDTPRTSKGKGQEQHWQVLQKRTFTRYMNSKLACRNIQVEDLYEDLKSGVVLYNFLEVLTGESLKRFGKMTKGNMRIQHVANQNVVFKFFPEADIKLENIGVMDVVDGTPTPVLGLIWSIIAFYLVKELGSGSDDLAAVKKKVLKWCKRHARKRGVPVNNLTDSFADGKAFLAILNDIDNAGSPYEPSDPCTNFKAAFADAEDKYGVPQMLDPEDPALWQDEISMLTYLATLMDTLPDSVAQPDPNLLIDEIIEDNADQEFNDHLFRLCQCDSATDQGKEAANKVVDDAMRCAGLDIIIPGQLAEWKAADPHNAPTVLFYATSGLFADDEPFFQATKEQDTIKAKGARADKANVVAPIYAVRALKSVLTGDSEHAPKPACNVKICIGTDPPGIVSEKIPFDQLQDVDYVIVSEPGKNNGAFAALDTSQAKAALLYGCRGFAELDVACQFHGTSQQVSTPKAPDTVGPILDPAFALAHKISSLRDSQSAIPTTNQNQTIADLPRLSQDFIDYNTCSASLNNSEESVIQACRQAAGNVFTKTAPEFTQVYKDAYLALALEPGLYVASLETNNSIESKREPPFSYTPNMIPQAKAKLIAMLPPGYTDLTGARAKIETALSSIGGFKLYRPISDAEQNGSVGYLSDSRQPFAQLMTAALSKGYNDTDKIALAVSPTFAPVATAFDYKIDRAAVFQAGPVVPDENFSQVSMPDVITHTKALARIVSSFTGDIPKEAPTLVPYGPNAVKPPQRTAPPVPPEKEIPPPRRKSFEPKPTPAAPKPAAPPAAPTPKPAAPAPAPTPKPAAPAPAPAPVPAPKPAAPAAPIPKPAVQAQGLEAELLAEVNKLRCNPKAYATTLESLLPLYKDDKSFWPEDSTSQPFMTHEGKAAVEEAINYLRTNSFDQNMRPLIMHQGMNKAAKDHVNDLVKSGDRLGHTGSDGSKPADRLSRYGRWFERASECLAYRHKSADMLVSQLVIDDGMNSRTQRNTVLSPEMRAIGCAITEHPSHGTLAVLTFAGGYGPLKPLDTQLTVDFDGSSKAFSDDFKQVLDSIPVVAVHDQVEEAANSGKSIQLKYSPGSLKMTIWPSNSNEDSKAQVFGVEWEI